MYIKECETAENETRLWRVVDENGNEIFGPVECPSICEDWIKEEVAS